jgi:hypothetical protein
MELAAVIASFMEEVQEDPRISPVHISLYLAIVQRWAAQGGDGPVSFKARLLMPVAKIGGRALFCRTIRQLHEYGYLRYEPSFKPDEPSKVWVAER